MKKRLLFTVAAIFCCIAVLVSCNVSESADYTAFRRKGFEASVEGELNGLTFAANLSVDAPEANGTGGRDFCLTFSAPKTLSGICISRTDGVQTVRVGSAVFDKADEKICGGWLSVIQAFLFEGTEQITKANGQTQVKFVSPEGTYCIITYDISSNMPQPIYVEFAADGNTAAFSVRSFSCK